MHKTSTPPGRLERPRSLRGRIGTPRRLLVAPLAGLLAAAVLLLAPALASADTASTLTVVGTSDVSDSGLVPNVIMPDFVKAFPQYTFKYVGSATGVAINSAKAGTGGPSALIVHAASLENQFVAGGYSYNNQYGNAIFTNDFVLAGPKGDPAGVGANAAHNIAQSFADIATAGASGHATFLTRGGTTTASGTTVEEHAIWALVNSSGLKPASLVLCTVSAADGGGMSPIKSTVQATSGLACPDSGTVNGTDAPAWYFVNAGANQGANVIATNACTVGTSGANTCYVLTDRGTYDYLSSGTSPSAGTAGIPNLAVLSSDNSASAPGGQNELVNYFHVYIINPSKPGETVNLPAAQDFVSLLTSPTFQSSLKDYLPSSAGGPPFTASASPLITTTKKLPTTYKAGKKWTVAGTVTNAQPGYPAPSGKPVSIDQIVAGVPVPVATGKTSSTGAYSISYVPPATGSYEVVTPQISQIEIPTLSPPYGDILSPAATTPVKVTVHSAVTSLRVKSEGGKAVVLGQVSPGTRHVKATVTVYDRKGSKGAFKKVATDKLSANDANFAVALNLAAAQWQFKVSFADSKAVVGSTSKTVKATIGPKPSSSLTLKSATVKKGALTLSGSVKPGAITGTKVELLGLRTSGTSARFADVGKVTLKAGATKFTIRAKLKRSYRWILQLEQVRKGQAPSYSGLKTVNVT
jgi:tungstate transport system substrate-binding protein